MYSLKSNSIVLSSSVKDFLSELERNLDFDFVVTSGTRTPEQQVSAMFYKINQGENLRTIYKDDNFADLVQNAYPDTQAAIKIVRDYARAGGGSSHLRGLGVDIRTRDKTAVQRKKIIDTSLELGAPIAIYEPTPPHIHITVNKKKFNLGTIAVLILLIRGISWLKK